MWAIGLPEFSPRRSRLNLVDRFARSGRTLCSTLPVWVVGESCPPRLKRPSRPRWARGLIQLVFIRYCNLRRCNMSRRNHKALRLFWVSRSIGPVHYTRQSFCSLLIDFGAHCVVSPIGTFCHLGRHVITSKQYTYIVTTIQRRLYYSAMILHFSGSLLGWYLAERGL